MDDYKKQKKAWNKGRRKAVRPFKGLAVLCIVLCVLFSVAAFVFDYVPAAFKIVLGGSDYKIVDGDETAIYYEADYETDDERVSDGKDTAYTVSSEGITLLKNEGDVLPLASGTKVSLFGYGSVDLTYGGTGSAGLDLDVVSTLKEGFEAVGFEVNETLWDFYEGLDVEESLSGVLSILSDDYYVNEPSLDTFTDEVWDSVEDYGTVIFTISRVGGEGSDLPNGSDGETDDYLVLSDNERAVLQHLAELKEAGAVESIIVLLNTSNTVQLDFVDDESYGVDAVVYCGGLGERGVEALADILVGTVNPSGHLGDTYLADNSTSPTYVNFGSYTYVGAEEAGLSEDDYNTQYVVYQEGIYVGYRYYETRYEDYVMGTGNAGDYSYSDDVAYAFGSGLSYTTFSWSDFAVVYDEVLDVYTVSVTVINTGEVAGKDVVEVYAQSPYTAYDQENSVEKAAVVLVGYDKTDELAPGASQTLTITVEGADLASYDAYGAGTYIMDAGSYYLTAAEDAHAAVNNVLAAKGYSPANTDGRMDAEGDAAFVYGWEESELDATTYSVSASGATIENQFDDADINLSEYVGDQSITYLSRADWEGTFPTETYVLTVTDEMADQLAVQRYDAETYDGAYADAEMPTTGADNGLSIIDMMGLDYDDEQWEDLLDQLSVEDMANLLGDCFHFTNAIESINLPGTRDENGPTGLTSNLFGDMTDIADVKTMGLPSEDIMAATWNVDVMAQVGEIIGEDCIAADVSYLYGPGANTHRSNYAGRNFEYFSEDGYLAAQLLAAEVSAIESNGVHVMIKHFALNDQETDRAGISTWANEQSIREIYLRAYQDAIEENELAGVMTAYNRIGCHWAGSDEGLIEGVLRSEWGSIGVTITDNSGFSDYYMNGVDMVLAGADLADAMTAIEANQMLEYADDPAVVSAMRDACHRVLYSMANGITMNGLTSESTVKVVDPWYLTVANVIKVVAGVGAVACIAMAVNRTARYRRANPKPRKRDFVDAA